MSSLYRICLLGAALVLGCGYVSPAILAAEHDATTHFPSGIRRELVEGITPADFLRLGDSPKTVKLLVVAVFSEENHGMNFNGYSHGKAKYTIPTGWKVEVTFINPSPVPHSVVVVEKEKVKKLQMGAPVFDGASVPNAATGVSFKKVVFSFTASEPGEYALACGFPAHAAGGHWIGFDVQDGLSKPTLKLGNSDAVEAK
jgi:plastocyanin